MSKLIVMVGIQGSGKSTIAKELAKEYGQDWEHTGGPYSDWGGCAMTHIDAPIVSSDEIRKEFPNFGNEKVFKELYSRVNKLLEKGANVIMDATNITIKARKQIFEMVKVPCEKIAYVINTSYEECVRRVKERNEDPNQHFVPLDVVEKYWKSFQCPAKFEGWDEIILHNKIEFNKDFATEIYNQMLKFDQDNPNHTYTLGHHSGLVFKLVLGNTFDKHLAMGVQLHDVGKLFTKVPNKKDSSYSSYYGHENVGGYWKMCNGWSPEEIKYETYHMHPYQWKTDKAHEKWKKIFGEEMYNNLLFLNRCDREAH